MRHERGDLAVRVAACGAVMFATTAWAFADGSVTLTVERGGRVTLRGDDASNAVDLSVEGHDLVVRGVGSTMLSDGTTGRRVSFPTTPPAVRFEGGGGDDAVTVSSPIGALVFDGGDGNDLLLFAAGASATKLVFVGGAGDDFVSNDGDGFSLGALRIVTGPGNDEVDLRGLRVAHAATVRLGSGHDRLRLSDGAVTGTLRVGAGAGGDRIGVVGEELSGRFAFDDGAGNDSLDLERTHFLRPLDLRFGAGLDHVEMLRTACDRTLGVAVESADLYLTSVAADVVLDMTNTGAGIGTVRTSHVAFPASLTVRGGSGVNQLEMYSSSVAGVFSFVADSDEAGHVAQGSSLTSAGCTFHECDVVLGGGDNALTLAGSVFESAAQIDLGGGDDDVSFRLESAAVTGPNLILAPMVIDAGTGRDSIDSADSVTAQPNLTPKGFELRLK